MIAARLVPRRRTVLCFRTRANTPLKALTHVSRTAPIIKWNHTGKSQQSGSSTSSAAVAALLGSAATVCYCDSEPKPEAMSFVVSQHHLTVSSEANPLPTEVPPPIAPLAGTLGVRHVICIIGLPYRGKPFIAHRLGKYLEFFHGAEVQVFNIKDHVQDELSVSKNDNALLENIISFIGGVSANAAKNMKDLVNEDDSRHKNVDTGKVAIVTDSMSQLHVQQNWSGTNKERRRWIEQNLHAADPGIKLMFVEVIVKERELVMKNLHAKLGRAPSPEENAEEHAVERQYMRSFVTIQEDGSEDDLSFIKVIDYSKIHTNCMHGYLRMRIAQFLSVLDPFPKTIYLSRHGFSEYNRLKKVGGNPPLTEWGQDYSRRLGKWVEDNIQKDTNGSPVKARLWTSSLQRTIMTAQHIPHPILTAEQVGETWKQMAPRVYRNLDEIYAGECEGLTYAEIKKRFPAEAKLRGKDKLGYRYPRGESYLDLINRIDPVVHEMFTYGEPLVIVSHQALLRPFRYYLMELPREDCPSYEIPLHTVMKITWDGWNSPKEECFYLGPEIPNDDGQKNL